MVINGQVVENESLSFVNPIIENYKERIDKFCEEITTKETKKEKLIDKKERKLEVLLGSGEILANKNLLSLSHMMTQITNFIFDNSKDLQEILFEHHPLEKQTESSHFFNKILDTFLDVKNNFSSSQDLSFKSTSNRSSSDSSLEEDSQSLSKSRSVLLNKTPKNRNFHLSLN